MNSLAFDTHKAVKALTQAGAAESLAEAVVATVGAALSEHAATKDDIAGDRTDNDGADYRNNYWFDSQIEFNVYFESAHGAIFGYLQLDRIEDNQDEDQIRYLPTASRALYFKPWGLTRAQREGWSRDYLESIGFIWSQGQLKLMPRLGIAQAYAPPKPNHCLNITLKYNSWALSV